MREQDYKDAMAQIELAAAAQQRIISACAAGVNPAAAPRYKRLPWAIAIAAALVLLLAGGTLLPGLLNTGNSFTITAYALDGESKPVVLGGKAKNFSFQSGDISGYKDSVYEENLGMGYALSYLYLGGVESRGPIRFHCEGKDIESITYTSQGCSFTEKISLVGGLENYVDIDNNGISSINKSFLSKMYGFEDGIVQISWGFYNDGMAWPIGTAILDIGNTYTVAYAQQDEASYQIRYPLQAVRKEYYDGVSPIIMEIEAPVPSGVLHQPDYVYPMFTWYYIAKEARITVTVNFANGTTQSKELLLALKPTSTNWSKLSVKVVD